MIRQGRDDNEPKPLSKRRGSLWARLERQSLWIVFGVLGGTAAGTCSLDPAALQRLVGALPGWSNHSPSAGGPLAAVQTPPPASNSAPTLATAPVVPAQNGAKPSAAPVPAKIDDERAADANSVDLLEEDGPLWDSSQSEDWDLAARSVVPGQTWQDAANIADWPNVAQQIDSLPVEQREEPGTRYARAVAARELGQYKIALQALQGLESKLPLLEQEIITARAHCQLEVGPFEAAYEYFTRDPSSPADLIQAARASLNAGNLERAQLTIERAFQKNRRQGSETRQGRKNEIAARALRARIAEVRQQPRAAARDWLWLATEAPTDERARQADELFERLSGERFTKLQRMDRLSAFGTDGRVELALREGQRLAAAPGVEPPPGEVTASLGWAYYHARTDYGRASTLFRTAAEQSEESRVKYLFFTARALSRNNQDEQAISEYQALAQRFPASPYAEQARYRIARLHYSLGHWSDAERAYSDYLERYGKNGSGERLSTSRFELAVTRLALRQRTDEAARIFNQLARKERNAQRRSFYEHLEAVALEATQDPRKVAEAMDRYRAIVDNLPLSFAAMVSAARLRALGQPEVHRVRLPSDFNADFVASTLLPQLPDKARFLAAIGLHTDAERALFDERMDVRRRYSDRENETLCQMFGSLDRGYRSLALADRWLKSDQLRRPPSSQTLWAWRCAYPKPYNTIVEAVERRYQLPESLVYAVMRQESAFRPNVVSPAGAVGLMQLMPSTARRAADEITQQPGAPWVPDPHRPTNVVNNVELGGFYLNKLLGLLGRQMPVAIAAYNAGPGAVSQWLKSTEDLPVDVWVAHIPYEETRDYVSLVLSNWLAYRYLGNPNDLPELTLALSHAPQPQALAEAY
jgi:soluble lytic murein transglycosylase